jgi:periplasmic divalent cation tolerance protein
MAKKRSKIKKVIMAYVTTKNQKEALSIGTKLIEKKLAACINIIPSMISRYEWEGKIETVRESILIVKSLAHKKKVLIKEIKQMHSYSVPCVMFFDVSGGNKDYVDWLGQGVSEHL